MARAAACAGVSMGAQKFSHQKAGRASKVRIETSPKNCDSGPFPLVLDVFCHTQMEPPFIYPFADAETPNSGLFQVSFNDSIYPNLTSE